MGGGYSPPFTVEQLFERVASIEGVSGVELVSNWHLSAENATLVDRLLREYKLDLVAVIPDHFGIEKWGKGSFSSKNSQIRKDAVSYTKEMMDIVSSLGGNMISLWPGQDGYDYYFQADYIQERTWFEDGIRECAQYKPNFQVSIEYKPKEPRNRCYASNVYSTLLMVQAINLSNVGVTVDYGHAAVAYENVAESVAVLAKTGNKLFHMHMNDCYGLWDDDMICGSIHTIPFLELFYWLKRTNYQGYISTDQYPYREDGRDAVAESIEWMKLFIAKINETPEKELDALLQSGNAVDGSRMLRKMIMGSTK